MICMQVAGNVLNQLLGLALLGCFYEVVTRGIALTSGHNEVCYKSENVRCMRHIFARFWSDATFT